MGRQHSIRSAAALSPRPQNPPSHPLQALSQLPATMVTQRKATSQVERLLAQTHETSRPTTRSRRTCHREGFRGAPSLRCFRRKGLVEAFVGALEAAARQPRASHQGRRRLDSKPSPRDRTLWPGTFVRDRNLRERQLQQRQPSATPVLLDLLPWLVLHVRRQL